MEFQQTLSSSNAFNAPQCIMWVVERYLQFEQHFRVLVNKIIPREPIAHLAKPNRSFTRRLTLEMAYEMIE